MMHRVVGLALVVVALGACSDKSTNRASSGEASPTTTAAADTMSGSTPETTAKSGATEGAACKTVMVTIPEFKFVPNPVKVKKCDSVVWENRHNQAHTATGTGDYKFATGIIEAGSMSKPIVFDRPGSFSYICSLHPFMKGTVEVSA